MRSLEHSVAFRVSEAEWQQLGQLAKRQGLSVSGLAQNVVLGRGANVKAGRNKTTAPVHSVAFRVSEAEWQRLGQLAHQHGLSVGGLARNAILELLGGSRGKRQT